jgi:chromosome segregation ATPase
VSKQEGRRGRRARDAKEAVMGRTKEAPRGRLATLQDLIVDGSKSLVDQAQNLTAGVQQRLIDVGRGVEDQLTGLIGSVEERLSERLDLLVSGLATTIRRDVDRLRERVRGVENRITDIPKEGLRELMAPVQSLAVGASDRVAGALARIEELGLRAQQLERRIAEVGRSTARDSIDGDDFRQRLERVDQRLTDLGREVGTKLGELGALRERLTRIEGRVLESSKEQIARAGESAGLRDRLARLEARLSDLSKEQLARAVETAGLRERLFRVEQGAPAPSAAPPPVNFDSPPPAATALEE